MIKVSQGQNHMPQRSKQVGCFIMLFDIGTILQESKF